ncbi:MAG TPA: hypothetical protein VJQ82_06375 [Terriglobales bacterium]|nr:hypothetical protein [Terriglobales bacterium]
MNQLLIRSLLRNLWRRWPITIVTTSLAVPIAGWAYIHMSDSSRATMRAYAAEKNVPAKLSGAVPVTSPSQAPVLVAKPHRALPAFRRVEVGPNEVDYVAEDVTVRIFSPPPKLRSVQHGSHVEVGDDVTVHYFADNGAGKVGRRE